MKLNWEETPTKTTPNTTETTTSTTTSTSTENKKKATTSSTNKSKLRLISFNIFFFFSIICLHVTQLVVFPIIIVLNFTLFNKIWLYYNSLSRKTFAIILILVTQIFAPTKLILTSDNSFDLENSIIKDSNGNVISIDLPSHSIIMANHQIYADWLYIWSLAYLADLHSALIIILKASLKWVPIVGPAMQMFCFIFLNRSWATDKQDLLKQINKLSNQTYFSIKSNKDLKKLNKLALLIFPEGTLVSSSTRPLSKKYADKLGFDDLRNCLLPRSTGTLFCLRALSRKIPNMKVIDLTVGYPGIPSEGYGQDYYTLQSIFGHGNPPPKVHIHMKIIPIKEIPIGRISSIISETNFDDNQEEEEEVLNDPTREEIEKFDQWLRDIWKEKDENLSNFYTYGSFLYSNTHTHTHKNNPSTPTNNFNNNILSSSSSSSSSSNIELSSEIKIKNSYDSFLTFLLSLPGFLFLFFFFKKIISFFFF